MYQIFIYFLTKFKQRKCRFLYKKLMNKFSNPIFNHIR